MPMFTFMQTIKKGLVCGLQTGYLAMHNKAFWGITAKYDDDKGK